MKREDPTPKRIWIWEQQILIDPDGSHPEEKYGQGATDLDRSRWIPPRRNFWVGIKEYIGQPKKLTLTFGTAGLPLRSWPQSSPPPTTTTTTTTLTVLWPVGFAAGKHPRQEQKWDASFPNNRFYEIFFCPFRISYFADSEMGRKRKGERKSFSSHCKVAYLGKKKEREGIK